MTADVIVLVGDAIRMRVEVVYFILFPISENPNALLYTDFPFIKQLALNPIISNSLRVASSYSSSSVYGEQKTTRTITMNIKRIFAIS